MTWLERIPQQSLIDFLSDLVEKHEEERQKNLDLLPLRQVAALLGGQAQYLLKENDSPQTVAQFLLSDLEGQISELEESLNTMSLKERNAWTSGAFSASIAPKRRLRPVSPYQSEYFPISRGESGGNLVPKNTSNRWFLKVHRTLRACATHCGRPGRPYRKSYPLCQKALLPGLSGAFRA